MAQMTGADAEDLERGASRLESVGTQIGGMRRPLRSQLYSSSWDGRAAVRFRSEWDRIHGPALSEAEQFLRHAGQNLRAQAEEQRRASNMGGGGHGPSAGGGGPSDLRRDLDEIREVLEKLGVPIAKIEEILGRLGLLNDLGLLKGPLKALAENEALSSALSVAGKALDYAGMIVDFLTVIADHPELPLDEALVFASATMAVGIATSVGVKAASKAIGGAVAGMFSGGVATVVGVVVGEVVGTVMNEAFDAADEQFNITETVAQQTLETYRFGKERDWDLGRIAIDGASQIVGEVAEGAQNIASDLVDGAQNIYDGTLGRLSF